MPNRMAGTVWDDARSSLTGLKTGASAPTFTQFKTNGAGSTGVYAYAFSKSAVNELFGAVQLPHRYRPGTDIVPHVHWVQPTTAAGNVVFELEYVLREIDGVYATNTTVLSVTTAAPAAAFRHTLSNFAAISGETLRESAVILYRIARLGNDGADTLDEDIFVTDFDFHVRVDKHGTGGQAPSVA